MRIGKVFTCITLILFFLFHISCTLFYTLPSEIVPQSAREYSAKYMSPLFDQGWSLFAPVPEVNKKVYVRYESSSKWNPWQAPFEPFLRAYQENRIGPYGKIALSMNSTLHYLYLENKENFTRNALLQGDTTSGYFRVLKHAITELALQEDKKQGGMQTLVVYHDVRKARAYCIYYVVSTAK